MFRSSWSTRQLLKNIGNIIAIAKKSIQKQQVHFDISDNEDNLNQEQFQGLPSPQLAMMDPAILQDIVAALQAIKNNANTTGNAPQHSQSQYN